MNAAEIADEHALSDEARELLSRMLRAQAYRELGAMRLFESALGLASGTAEIANLRREIAEERRHLQAALALWSRVTSIAPADLLTRADERLAALPLPPLTSALDLGMARFLFDRAGYFQLSEYRHSAFLPYRALVAGILRDEAVHGDAGARELTALANDAAARDGAKVAVHRWLPVALHSFGRPDSDGDRRAVALGLKPRGAAAVRHDFLANVSPLLAAIDVRPED